MTGPEPYAEYREGGAPWLDTVPTHWETAQIRRLAIISNGADYKDVEVAADGYPVYGSGGVFRRASAWLYDGESVLFGRKGTIDRPLHVNGRFWTVDTMFYTRLHSKVHGRFLYWYATTMPFSYYSTSTALPSMTQGDLAGHPAPLPPLPEQRAIADYLDRETAQIDALIGKQERLIETLRERQAAVIEAAFLSTPGLTSTRVRNLLAQRPSYGVLVPTYVDDGVPFVRVGDLGRLDRGMSLPKIPLAQAVEFKRTRLRGGEILLGVVGNMGKSAIAPEWLAGANVARAVAVLRCRADVDAALVNRWFETRRFRDQAMLATGSDTAQPTLGMKDLAGFSLLWPSEAEDACRLSDHLDEQTSKIDAIIMKVERFIEVSKERRSALITAAVTGQIDLRGRAA